MTVKTRKWVIVVSVAIILLLANFLLLAEWLDGVGVIDCARSVNRKYLTGTAITVIMALLILSPSSSDTRLLSCTHQRQCPVCDERIRSGGRYCPACGSRVSA